MDEKGPLEDDVPLQTGDSSTSMLVKLECSNPKVVGLAHQGTVLPIAGDFIQGRHWFRP